MRALRVSARSQRGTSGLCFVASKTRRALAYLPRTTARGTSGTLGGRGGRCCAASKVGGGQAPHPAAAPAGRSRLHAVCPQALAPAGARQRPAGLAAALSYVAIRVVYIIVVYTYFGMDAHILVWMGITLEG